MRCDGTRVEHAMQLFIRASPMIWKSGHVEQRPSSEFVRPVTWWDGLGRFTRNSPRKISPDPQPHERGQQSLAESHG
jgi:hypothetical protein